MSADEKCLPKILVVDDRPENLRAIQKMLVKVEAEIICASSGNDALILTLQHRFALCLLDVMMPEMDGFETAELIRQNEATEGLPIIFVTAMDKSDVHLFRGYESGAVDYLYKPLIKEVLLAKVIVFLDIECRQQELLEANRFIEQQKQLLEEQATRDGLTGLFNHACFQKLITREFAMAKRHQRDLTLLMCDLDYFKDVNDTYGHQMGDLVLQEFATILTNQIRETDLLARYGGEEFILALPDTDLAGAFNVAEKIRFLAQNHEYRQGKTTLQVTVSIGVASVCEGHLHSNELIEQADVALYKAKAAGRNRVSTYEEAYCQIAGDDLEKASFEQLRSQLLKVLGKNRTAALAAFEGLVHTRLKDSSLLKERNDKAVRLMNLFGKRLHLPQEMVLVFRRSFKLHDLFRLYVGDSALNNDNPLDELEKQVIANQPLLLKELTDQFDFFSQERQILLHHHEHYDGSGYPEGLEGDETPLGARIFGLVDAIIAMVLPSWPRTPASHDELIKELRTQSGTQFDPMLVEQAIQIIQEEGV